MGEGDLGAGIHISSATGPNLLVRSEQIDLGWQPPQGKVTGTAVFWQEQPYQVVTREESRGGGYAWILAPWPTNEPARNVFRLDQESIANLEQQYRRDREAARRRGSTILFLPVLGFAPGSLQQHWWYEWGFPARLATTTSAVLSLVMGAIGLIQIGMARGGQWFIPESLSFLLPLGPYLLGEAIIRLFFLVSQGEPIGSLLGLPFNLFFKKPPPPSRVAGTAPEVRSFNESQGSLELWSKELRHDWEEPGLLPYRGRQFQLQEQHESGGGWLYLFAQVESDSAGAAPALRLLPSPIAKDEPARLREPTPSFIRTTVLSTLICLAPRVYQEEWAEELDTSPVWFTLMGSGAELIGGIVNLANHLKEDSPLVLFDLLLAGEGLFRIVWMAVKRHPVGSFLGLPLIPLFKRWV
jgi:hypothetical protein